LTPKETNGKAAVPDINDAPRSAWKLRDAPPIPRHHRRATNSHTHPLACLAQEEPANALHYEAAYRAPFFYDYDVTGAPMKAHNPRYPQPPLPPPPRVPEGSASGKH